MKISIIFLLFAGANSIILECDFKIKNFGTFADRYTCEVVSADFSDNPIQVTSVNGTHLQSQSDQTVLMISWTIFSDLTIIPKGFSSIFPRLIGIHIEKTLIEELTGNEIDEYTSLNYFSLTHSNITRVSGNFFNKTAVLLYVGFNNNKIIRVGEGLLNKVLAATGVVDFSNNPCINMRASSPVTIDELKQKLIEQCADVDPTTTTSTTTTTTTTSTSPATSTSTRSSTNVLPSSSEPIDDSSTTTQKPNSSEINKLNMMLMSVILFSYLLI